MKEVLDKTLNKILETEDYHQHAPEWGERAWRVKGKFADVIYWDVGNGWCEIIKVIPKEGQEDWIQQFFEKIEASDDA